MQLEILKALVEMERRIDGKMEGLKGELRKEVQTSVALALQPVEIQLKAIDARLHQGDDHIGNHDARLTKIEATCAERCVNGTSVEKRKLQASSLDTPWYERPLFLLVVGALVSGPATALAWAILKATVNNAPK
jgi:hypothetical protein